ncbi:MAG TPA: exopolysaccharide biosynthesis protein [Solirubrobacteraceae bacterium]|nr:exopolysaccharide biosynthesis protein [Solirubrobacteraceae bacterium]
MRRANRNLASHAPSGSNAPPEDVSVELQRWLDGEDEKTLVSLIELFGQRGFAMLFVVLLALPALPLPTGGATHVFEAIAMLVALELIAGRETIWLPARWRTLKLAGGRRERFLVSLMKLIRRLERFSKPRLRKVFGHRLSNIAFGLVVIAWCVAAFVAPPFSGLDTLPAMGVVLLSLGVLLEDFLIVVLGLAVGVAGVTLEVVLGGAALHGLSTLF